MPYLATGFIHKKMTKDENMWRESSQMTALNNDSNEISFLSQRKPTKAIKLVEQSARLFADKPAVVAGKHSYSYEELVRRIYSFAAWFSEAAPESGRVIICSKNLVETAVVPLALEASGLVRVPINWRTSAFELESMIAICQPSIIVHDKHTEATVREALSKALSNHPDLKCTTVAVEE